MNSKKIILALVLLGLILVIWYLNKSHYLEIEKIVYFLRSRPILAPFLFIIIYALLIVSVLVPTLPMNLAAGFIWGGFWGGIISIAGGSLGASIAFLISRYLAFDYISHKFKNGGWSGLYNMIRDNDWKVVVFARVNIAFPFGIVSYLFGLTEISFVRYLLTTALAIVPLVFVFSYFASSVGGFILNESLSRILNNFLIFSIACIAFIIAYVFLRKFFPRKNNF